MRFPILALLASAALSPPVLADEHGKTATASDEPDAVIAAITGQAGEPTGRDVHYFEPNPDTAGYLALPEGEGPFPAVLLIHEWDGLVERVRQVADGFAEQGYIAFAADLYGGRTGSSREENIALVREARADQEQIIDNLDAAVKWIETNTPATGRVATIGWCFGGGIALSYAIGGDDHEGTAIFYGSLVTDPDQLGVISHPVYGTFARNDRGIPVEDVNDFVDALREMGIDNDVHIYDNVDHGFWLHVDRDPERYGEPASDAWQRLKTYLDGVL